MLAVIARRPLSVALLSTALLGLGACEKSTPDEPAPAPPAVLQGSWKLEKSSYKFLDKKGATTDEGSSTTRNVRMTITDNTWRFTRDDKNTSDYLYTRDTDSTATTFFIYDNTPAIEKRYSILELKEHSLTTRYVYNMTDGGKFMEKEVYSR